MNLGGQVTEEYVIRMVTNEDEVKRLTAEIEARSRHSGAHRPAGNIQRRGTAIRPSNPGPGRQPRQPPDSAQHGPAGDAIDRTASPQHGSDVRRSSIRAIPGLATHHQQRDGNGPGIGDRDDRGSSAGSNWSTFTDLWSKGGTKTEAQEMEELGKKTEKTADELSRYNQLKEKQHQIEAAGSVKSSEQDAAEKRYDQGVKAAGGSDKILGEIAASLTKEGEDGVSRLVGGDSYERYMARKRFAEAHSKKIEGDDYHEAQRVMRLDANAEAMRQAKEENKKAVDEEARRIAGAARSGQ